MTIRLNLTEIDPIAQETLAVLKQRRIGKDFYVCDVHSEGQGDKHFLFEGSIFCEYWCREEGHALLHPLTRKTISQITIYKASKGSEEFETVFSGTRLEPENYVPILASNPDKTPHERAKFYSKLGDALFQKGFFDCAITYYRFGALLGYSSAQWNLATLLDKKEKHEESLYWAIKSLESIKIDETKTLSPEDFYRCARAFEKNPQLPSSFSHAFYFWRQGALLGNPFFIAKTVQCYEGGKGITKNLEKAEQWRAFLPMPWRKQPILPTYFTLLSKDPNNLRIVSMIDLPQCLLEEELPPPPSDPDTLFPNLRQEWLECIPQISC